MHVPQEQVRDFHRACNLRRPEYPDIDWRDLQNFQCDLILEEYEELYGAIKARDSAGVIREMCDLLYVVYGAAVAIGVDLEPFFEEVHRANMEKTQGPKRSDGKQLKPLNWRPPDTGQVLKDVYEMEPYILDTNGFDK